MSIATDAPAAHWTPSLNKALAAVQAEYKRVQKGQTGTVKGETKDGRAFNYDYKYADLADVSEVILPMIGRHGLAFTARPTLDSRGQFVLEYELVHESGESKPGTYPLPASGTAQQVGSAITYARRYALCAVTGIAPAEPDDDGKSASSDHQQYDRARSAGAAFADAIPAAQYRNRQEPREQPAQAAQAPPTDDPPSFRDESWYDDILFRAAAVDEDTYKSLWSELFDGYKAGKCTDRERQDAAEVIKARMGDIRAAQAEADAIEGVIVTEAPSGLEPGDAWASKVEEISSSEDADMAIADVTLQAKNKKITTERRDQVIAAIIERRQFLLSQMTRPAA